MTEDVNDQVRQLQLEEVQYLRKEPLRAPERLSIHYTELAPGLLGSPIATEWDFYRGEVSRLLAEGHEGKWVLIKGEQVVGIWDTEEEADQVRLQRYLMQPVLLKQVLTWEPVLRGGGYFRRWPS